MWRWDFPIIFQEICDVMENSSSSNNLYTIQSFISKTRQFLVPKAFMKNSWWKGSKKISKWWMQSNAFPFNTHWRGIMFRNQPYWIHWTLFPIKDVKNCNLTNIQTYGPLLFKVRNRNPSLLLPFAQPFAGAHQVHVWSGLLVHPHCPTGIKIVFFKKKGGRT